MLRMLGHKPQSGKNINVSLMVALITTFVWIPPTSGTITVVSVLTNKTLLNVDDAITRNFLSKSLIAGIEGFLVYSNPANACNHVTPPPLNNFPTNVTFYLLAQRYDCESKVKLENAHTAGYDGIVIHNVNSNTTDGMGDDLDLGASDLIHYVGFIGEYDGHRLMNYSLPDHKGYLIKIQDGEEITVLRGIVALVLGLLKMFGIFLGLAIAWEIFKLLIRLIGLGCETGFNWIVDSIVGCWRRRDNASCRRRYEELWRRHLPIPETDVDRNGTIAAPFQNTSNKNPSVTCVVCLEDFVQHDRISVLPCSHAFHNACILRWLTQERKVCPLCKRITTTTETIVYSEDPELDTTDDDEAPLFMTPSSKGKTPRPNQFSALGPSVFSQHKYLQTPAKQSQSLFASMPSAHDSMENSWYTISESASLVDAPPVSNAGTNTQSLSFLDSFRALSKSLPSSSVGYPGRIVASHLSHSTTGLDQSQSDSCTATGTTMLSNSDLGISTDPSHPHYFILEPDAEDEEMLSCVGDVEVEDVDPNRDH